MSELNVVDWPTSDGYWWRSDCRIVQAARITEGVMVREFGGQFEFRHYTRPAKYTKLPEGPFSEVQDAPDE